MARPANPELRTEILKAATAIVEECGPDCVTMRQVAERVGHSPTSIYLYFKDKSEVLSETVRMAAEDLAVSMDAASAGPTPLDRLRQRGRAYLVWGVTHPGLYQLMFQRPGDIEWTDAALTGSMRAGAETNDVIRQCIESGQIGPVGDLEGFQTATFAALHGSTSLAISRRFAPGAVSMSPSATIEAAYSVAQRLLTALLAQYPGCGQAGQVATPESA